jgi:hypothetical protein
VIDSPLSALVGHDVDTVSFVRDYVELRIDYSIVRAITEPHGTIDGVDWRLQDPGATELLRRYIGRFVVEAEVIDGDRLTLEFEDGSRFEVSLHPDDRVGPEAAHFVPAAQDGDPTPRGMSIW